MYKRQLLRADSVLRNGRLQQEIAANPGATSLTFKFNVGENIGRGFKRIGSSNPSNVALHGPLQRIDNITHAQITVVRNPTTGVWETITMFPALP